MKDRDPGLSLTEVAAYCDSKPGSSRTWPFGPSPLVFKAAGKMFALLGHLEGMEVVSLKCDPERSIVLRASFGAIVPGYHLNKAHWNTLYLDGSLPPSLVHELIDHAIDLVVGSPRRPRPRRQRGRAHR